MSTPLPPPLEPKKKWFDGTVNLPTILAVTSTIVGACYFGVTQYSALQLRVQRLEDQNVQQEMHFERLERSQNDLRSEIRDTLKDISGKLDKVMYDKYGTFNRSGSNRE